MLAEAPEVIRGSRSIVLNGYVVYVVQGDSYVNNREKLVQAISEIKAEVFSQDPKVVEGYTSKDLVPVYNPLIPPVDRLEAIERRATVMLAAERSDPYVFIGVSTARELAIRTSQGDVEDVLWMTRAVKEGHRRHGLGVFFSQENGIFHREATMAGLRTQSPAAIWSAIESNIFEESKLFPLDVRYSKDRRAREVMMQLFFRFSRHALGVPNADTGVARGDYLGENMAYIADPLHAPTMNILRRMENEFRMNFQKGDAMYLVGYAR